MKIMLQNKEKNNAPYLTKVQRQYVRVIKSGVFLAFKTVNSDWCIINTKMDIHKGMYIVNTEPFASCKVMLMHLSDFDSLFPGLQEIPETINWPLLQQHNNSRSN